MHGFLDPIALLARLNRFAQPSEVSEPVELLRAGAVLHARGLINSRVIQHNLDWVWPYWVERQFDPADKAFIPRSFSITHINLTHRNWTAIGWPDCPELPIVDPRGLVTPHYDQWSLDAWLLTDDGHVLLPSRAERARQRLVFDDGLTVETEVDAEAGRLTTWADVRLEDGVPTCRLRLRAMSAGPGWLVVSLRPYNPEGIGFIHDVTLSSDRHVWQVDGGDTIAFDRPVDRHHVSDYRAGDVYIHLRDLDEQQTGDCDIGMATAAALFRVADTETSEVSAKVPLTGSRPTTAPREICWPSVVAPACQLSVGDARVQYLYDAALRSLILHSPDDVYPGPYTYKRFWFRDAAFLVSALLAVGLTDRAERAIDRFPGRQTAGGYFHSQDGEWDSNGEALWAMWRFCELTGGAPKPAWLKAIRRGARWIRRKRLGAEDGAPHAGLLPAGFSAEHLGPNDYYYWDDFWGIAGLDAAAAMLDRLGDADEAARLREAATAFRDDVDASLERVAGRLGTPAMPASPYRRLDAGAIGSLAIGYPLQLCAPDDPRLLATVDFLLENCLVDGGFFQDMVHSGINAYLTLHMAQVLMRAGDPRFATLLTTVVGLASPTGQWPEAIHPATGGGCMGDGQHVWAAAEWLLMLRNCFVREEGERLVLAGGVARDWLDGGQTLRFGPAPTAFGPVTVEIDTTGGKAVVSWQADWRGAAPPIEVRLPGRQAVVASGDRNSVGFATAAAS